MIVGGDFQINLLLETLHFSSPLGIVDFSSQAPLSISTLEIDPKYVCINLGLHLIWIPQIRSTNALCIMDFAISFCLLWYSKYYSSIFPVIFLGSGCFLRLSSDHTKQVDIWPGLGYLPRRPWCNRLFNARVAAQFMVNFHLAFLFRLILFQQ